MPRLRGCAALLCWIATSQSLFGQRDLTDIPVPDPSAEQATFQIDDGWNVELFAGEAPLAKPIHMNWDNRNRLWIASSETYPQIKPGEPSDDKILVLEDSDGDGRADRSVVFADGLLIPTGVLPANDGDQAAAFVANSDQLIYLRDNDGDLVADERRVVLTGFGTEDTHHLLHSLRWGHDGWIYMNQSIYIHSHIETPWGVKRLNGGGIWRFHPSTKRLEIVVRGFVNPWGVHFDRYGQMFATDGAYGEGINYAFPGSVFVTAVGAKRLVSGLNPGSPKHCGLEILSGSHWPEPIRGTMVTNDFRAHRVCRFKVTDDLAGYESVQLAELIKTPHVAFRPIDAKQGLDGALYIADWYNPIIQHGEVDFRDPRRDRTHGRIWRLTHRNAQRVKPNPITDQESVTSNLARLADDADLTRLFAGQALRLQIQNSPEAAREVERYLREVVADASRGLEQLELLGVLEGLGTFDARLQSALLESSDGRLRAAAIHHIANEIRWNRDEQGGTIDPSQLGVWLGRAKKWIRDPHPRARLETVRLLAELSTPEAAAVACMALHQPMDRFLDFAVWQTMRDLAPVWLPEFRAGSFRFGNDPVSIAFALRAVEDPTTIDAVLTMLESEQPDAERLQSQAELVRLVAELGHAAQQCRLLERLIAANRPIPLATESERGGLLQSLVDASSRRKEPLPIGEPSTQRLLQLAKQVSEGSDNASATANALPLVALRALGAWRVPAARQMLTALAMDETKPAAVRSSAIQAVARYADDAARQQLETLSSESSVVTSVDALRALTELDLGLASRLLVERMEREPDKTSALTPLVVGWLARKDGAGALASALDGQSLDPNAARQLKSEVRRMNAPADLLAAIDKAGKLQDNRWRLTDEVRNRWLQLAQSQGDASRGEWVYRRTELQCAQCHRIAGVGGLVGPDLTSIGAQAPSDYLLEALLEPAAKVKEGYNAKIVRTEDEEVLAGIPIRESDDEVALRLADGREIAIPKSEIVDIKDSRSLMPDGLLDSLTEMEAIDLLRFMIELGKIDGTMLARGDGSLRNWEVLEWTQEAFTRFNRTSLDAVAGDQADFRWLAHAALVSGKIPTQGLPVFRPHQGMPDYTFLRYRAEAQRAGKIALDVSDAPKGGLVLWANGKPIPVEGPQVSWDVSQGPSEWFLGINREVVGNTPISVRVLSEQTTATFAP